MSGDHAPLIVTAMLDSASKAHFDALRTRYFPPERNYLQAHVTVFHQLPGVERSALETSLRRACAGHPPATFEVTGLRLLGGGCAYGLKMPAVSAIRETLAREWNEWLTRQDRQPWSPHLTVQNKVSPPEARSLYEKLQRSWTPASGTVLGLQLWAYLGGPWAEVASVLFADEIA